MATLVDDILDFARGRLGGGIPVQRQRVALDGLLQDLVGELRSAHPDRVIEAAVDLADPVACDPRRIGQLVSNLLANALVHGAQDRPVRLTAHGRDGELARRDRLAERLVQERDRALHGARGIVHLEGERTD